MRIPALLVVPALAAALLASACSGNSPPAPLVVAAGWSWDPAVAEDRPLPVVWWGSSVPAPLPLLDCTTGSAQAIAILTDPVAHTSVIALAGFLDGCGGATASRMRPVVWTRNAAGDFDTETLLLPDRQRQGTALALDMRFGDDARDVFVGGATGLAEAPFPMVWKNGVPAPAMSGAILGTVLPPGYDSGIVTSIVAGENFVAAGGIMHVDPGASPVPPVSPYQGVVWVLDPTLTVVIPVPIDQPPEVTSGSFGPSVSLTALADTVLVVAALSSGPGLDKPAVWSDLTAVNALTVLAPLGLDFTVGPYGAATGLSLVSGLPYLSGFVRPPASGGLPAPVIWGGVAQMNLSTADPALGLGAGEAIGILYEHAYVAGETYRTGTSTSGPALVSVPAYWDNGNRHDLQGLVPAATGGPIVSQPLYGWWRLPGTPLSDPPNWPYTGGFGEIAGGTRDVAAAGSGVAKTILVAPK
jgi:hypothetical protein